MTSHDDTSRGGAAPRPRERRDAEVDAGAGTDAGIDAGAPRGLAPPAPVHGHARAANDCLAPARPPAGAGHPGAPGSDAPGDAAAGTSAFARDLLLGLSQPARAIPCVWLYDRRGSELFEEITGLDEYYPTRTETRLLEALAPGLAGHVGPGADLVELGSGSSIKTRLLLQALPDLARYLPLDISAEFLHDAVAALRRDFPRLRITPVVADFNAPFTLPPSPEGTGRAARLGFFPGSTIGNFTPGAAVSLLARFRAALGPGAWLLVGVDTTQDPGRLVPAYDDARGVTAAFDLNLLARANRELGADFDLDGFQHEARFDAGEGRVEMHLVSLRAQGATVCGRRFEFRAGERIHTENAYKYRDPVFRALAARAGWRVVQDWRDDRGTGFAVYLARSAA